MIYFILKGDQFMERNIIDTLLVSLHNIEEFGVKSQNNVELTETYVQLYSVIEEFEVVKDLIKEEIVKDRKIELTLFPRYQKKIFLTEGNASTIIDAEKLYDIAQENKITDIFWKACKITIGILKGTILEQSIKEVSISIPSTTTILKVSKMTKQELVESTIKK
jgi:hypothetical protein